jgi:hypothetical protein
MPAVTGTDLLKIAAGPTVNLLLQFDKLLSCHR